MISSSPPIRTGMTSDTQRPRLAVRGLLAIPPPPTRPAGKRACPGVGKVEHPTVWPTLTTPGQVCLATPGSTVAGWFPLWVTTHLPQGRVLSPCQPAARV